MDTTTRSKILDMLKRDGGLNATDMARRLGISAMAVRQHLYGLAEDGLAVSEAQPDGVGRPTKLWRLTAAADAFFPQGYSELTADLMGYVRDAFGDEGMDKIVHLRTHDQIANYQARMNGASGLAARLQALAEIRTAEGYMAEVSSSGDDYIFAENHCPICAAARLCTGLCAAELELFRTVLGAGVRVERAEHILEGARRCAYRVTPV